MLAINIIIKKKNKKYKNNTHQKWKNNHASNHTRIFPIVANI